MSDAHEAFLVIDSGDKKENCNPFVEKIRCKSKMFQESMEGSSVCVCEKDFDPSPSVRIQNLYYCLMSITHGI